MKEIIITYLLNYIVIIVSAIIYLGLGFRDLDFFINGPCFYILNIYYIVVSIYLFVKNYKKEKEIGKRKLFFCFSFGISFSFLFNMIIIFFKGISIHHNLPISLSLLSSGIIGPIYEEILFRYIFYYRLRQKYSKRKSILISSIVFGLIHIHPVKVIYAFIFGIFLSYIYDKYKNIFVSIIMHIAANSVVLYLNVFNEWILFLSLFSFILYFYLLFIQSKTS